MKKLSAEDRICITIGWLCAIGLVAGCCFSLMFFFEEMYSQMFLSLILTATSFGFAFFLIPVANELYTKRKEHELQQLQ